MAGATGSLTGISSMATRQILADLAQTYEEKIGRHVAIESLGGVDAARRVREGAAVDLVVLALGVMEQLQNEGHLIASSVTGFVSSDIAVAVRSDAPQPDIGDEAAVRRALSMADKIGYSTGPSGEHLLRLCRGWGLGDLVAAKFVKAPPGTPVGKLLARGEVDLGFQQYSEFLDLPGIAIVGPLPPAIQATTIFAAAICSRSRAIDDTQAFMRYLTDPQNDAIKKRRGLDAPKA